MIKPFNLFAEAVNPNQYDIDSATDWWRAVPNILENFAKTINYIKMKLSEDDLKNMRVLYRSLKDLSNSNRESKKYKDISAEKSIAKEFLKYLNDIAPKTNMYVGISKTVPKSGRYSNSYGGRWVTAYIYTFGNSNIYVSYTF